MAKKIFPEERWERIAALVEERGRISVKELSALFRISPVTIRNDLNELERRRVLIRTHGGALVVNRNSIELSFDARERMQSAEKARIGEMAASLIHDGDAIALDASTTALQVARRIKNRQELTVVTNGIRIALELMDFPNLALLN
jgi:DeoR family fructose operon transcriptional repressor